MVKDRILINGIRVMAYCGALAEEHTRRQPFDIDIELRVDISKAAISDNLEDTVDYSWVLEEVNKYFEDSKIKLIERMAQIVADITFQDERVEKVKVTVKKLQPPVSQPLNYSGITISRIR